MASKKKQIIVEPETVARNTMGGVPSNLVYAFNKPWHGFGEEIQPGESVQETLVRAGLDFETVLSPISYGFGEPREDETREDFFARIADEGVASEYLTNSRRALYRKDTGLLFDVPRGGYHPIQNRDMVELFEEYVRAGDMVIETMGAFEDGRKTWLLADMDMGFDANGRTVGGDVVLGKILIYIPHIYGEAVSHKTTSISVVCSNTLEAARRQKSKVFKLWHNVAWSAERAAEAKANLDESRKQFIQLKEDAEILSKVKLGIEEARVFVAMAVGDVKRKHEDQGRNYVKVLDLYSGNGRGMALDSRKDTAWGVLNAVTEFSDWAYGNKKTSQEARLDRAWLGQGNVTKNLTRSALLEYAEGDLKLDAFVDRFVTEQVAVVEAAGA